jgi:hypothetical protein
MNFGQLSVGLAKGTRQRAEPELEQDFLLARL